MRNMNKDSSSVSISHSSIIIPSFFYDRRPIDEMLASNMVQICMVQKKWRSRVGARRSSLVWTKKPGIVGVRKKEATVQVMVTFKT